MFWKTFNVIKILKCSEQNISVSSKNRIHCLLDTFFLYKQKIINMCSILRYETVLPGQFIALQLLNARALGQWTPILSSLFSPEKSKFDKTNN